MYCIIVMLLLFICAQTMFHLFQYLYLCLLFSFSFQSRADTNLKFANVNRSLFRWKNDKHPKIPESIAELQSEFRKPEVLNKYGFSYEGEIFLSSQRFY